MSARIEEWLMAESPSEAIWKVIRRILVPGGALADGFDRQDKRNVLSDNRERRELECPFLLAGYPADHRRALNVAVVGMVVTSTAAVTGRRGSLPRTCS